MRPELPPPVAAPRFSLGSIGGQLADVPDTDRHRGVPLDTGEQGAAASASPVDEENIEDALAVGAGAQPDHHPEERAPAAALLYKMTTGGPKVRRAAQARLEQQADKAA